MPAENYMVPLKRAYDKPRTRRSNVAVKEIFDFLYKHTRKRKENIVLSKEVNEFVWKRGIQKPPRKIPISIREEGGKVYVFLKDSKEIQKFLNRDKETKEKKSIKEKVLEMKENIQNPKTDKKEKKKDTSQVKETSKKLENKKIEKVETTNKKVETTDKKTDDLKEEKKEVKSDEVEEKLEDSKK